MTSYYRIYFQGSRDKQDREQFKIRYKGKEMIGNSLREAISKLTHILNKEDELKIE